MKKYLRILEKCPLFYGISEDNLSKMLACLGARVEFFDKKYTVFSEGSCARYIGIVLTGNVQVIRIDYQGNRSLLSEVGQGEIFGEAFACSGTKALPISVVANTPSEIMLIDCDHILHICKNNCEFHQRMIFNLMRDLATKTIVFHQKLEIVSAKTTKDKLMTYLTFCAEKAGSDSFEIPFDRQELADYLEVDRSGLSTQIGKLKEEGIIEADKRHFRLIGYDI